MCRLCLPPGGRCSVGGLIAVATTVSFILLALYAVAVLTLAWNLARTMRLLRGQKSVSTGTRAGTEGRSLEVFVPVKDEQGHMSLGVSPIVKTRSRSAGAIL